MRPLNNNNLVEIEPFIVEPMHMMLFLSLPVMYFNNDTHKKSVPFVALTFGSGGARIVFVRDVSFFWVFLFSFSFELNLKQKTYILWSPCHYLFKADKEFELKDNLVKYSTFPALCNYSLILRTHLFINFICINGFEWLVVVCL